MTGGSCSYFRPSPLIQRAGDSGSGGHRGRRAGALSDDSLANRCRRRSARKKKGRNAFRFSPLRLISRFLAFMLSSSQSSLSACHSKEQLCTLLSATSRCTRSLTCQLPLAVAMSPSPSVPDCFATFRVCRTEGGREEGRGVRVGGSAAPRRRS